MPTSPGGWLLALVVTSVVVLFLVDAAARKIARHREEPPAAPQPEQTRRNECTPARPPRPRRIQTTAVRPRQPDGDPLAGQLLTRQTMWKGLTVLVIVLILGCAALAFAFDRSASKDRRAAANIAKAYITSLEQGHGATALRPWPGSSMPLYDLTACRDVDRRTTTDASGRLPSIVVTGVHYESDCVKGPHQENHDRIYVESDLYWVYYLGHTRP